MLSDAFINRSQDGTLCKVQIFKLFEYFHRATNEKLELFCQNSSGLFDLGHVGYNNYESKCAEHNAVIAIPSVNDLVWKRNEILQNKKIWTGVQRTGPYKENFTFFGNVTNEKICDGGDVFRGNVEAIGLANYSRVSIQGNIFSLRNELDRAAACVCVER